MGSYIVSASTRVRQSWNEPGNKTLREREMKEVKERARGRLE